MKRVLIAGFSTRHVAASAKKAGYEVYAVDHFCDMDLRECTVACYKFEELAELPDLIRKICIENRIEGIIPTSGAEDLEDLPVPLIGTAPEVGRRFQDKVYVQHFFEGLDIPIPPFCEKGEFPAVLKPVKGSGGWRNKRINGEDDIRTWQELFPDEPFILQKYIEGIPASVCCVTDGRKARAVGVNRQIMRGSGPYEYGFSGSQTPFDHPMVPEMIEYAQQAASASGCIGVVGIDFIVQDNFVFAIELNPRFVATLDTIERSTGKNLFSFHINACKGKIPRSMPVPIIYSIRKILFAEKPVCISGDLSLFAPFVADIPIPPVEYEEGGAIISVFGLGTSLTSAEAELDNTIRLVTKYIG
jgi:hypothetical protein